MAVCFLGIGTNLGDRRKNIKLAIRQIGALKDTEIIKLSSIFQTEPLGGPPGQPKFLNAALKLKTYLAPLALLRQLKKIEKKLGRKKTVPNGPRTIDLDILFYDNKILNHRELKIPHPRIAQREFVIKPLSEII